MTFFFGKDAIQENHVVNLNTLIYRDIDFSDGSLFPMEKPKKSDCLYWGSFRKDRVKYFNKYLSHIKVSTSPKNSEKFVASGVSADFIPRIDWFKDGLWEFKYSLYIEDEYTHKVFNNLSNRFYESIMYEVIPLFDINCKNTVEKSGIEFNDWLYVSSVEELQAKVDSEPPQEIYELVSRWKAQALEDKVICLESIENMLKARLGTVPNRLEIQEEKKKEKKVRVNKLDFI